MTEREKLEKEIHAMRMSKCWAESDIVAFVLADRRRIVEPLVVIKTVDVQQNEWSGEDWYEKAIDETLKLAGVNTGDKGE